jgi:hypothetical protein
MSALTKGGNTMPHFEKLDVELAAQLFEKPVKDESATLARKRVQAEFIAYLADIKLGEGGELTPNEGETKEKVRYQLEKAAKELKVKLVFKRRRDNKVIFRVVAT